MDIRRSGSQASLKRLAEHFSGAPTTAMTHIAIQELLDGKSVEWLEKVTDDQYRGRT
jgi:hypothetical protein